METLKNLLGFVALVLAAILGVGSVIFTVYGVTGKLMGKHERAPAVVDVYRDPLTGCEYVGVGGRNIHPRMQADGKQRCAP